jgi:hypothetical protein
MLPNKTKNWKKHFNWVNCGRQHLIPATCCDFSLWPEHINHDKCHFEHTLQYAKLWRKWSNDRILKEACIELESMTSPKYSWSHYQQSALKEQKSSYQSYDEAKTGKTEQSILAFLMIWTQQKENWRFISLYSPLIPFLKYKLVKL